MKKRCVDCDKTITGKKHCQKCYLKFHNPMKKIINKRKLSKKRKQKIGKESPYYKDGRTLKKYYCVDCGKKIWYGSTRCGKCNYVYLKSIEFNKGINNPMFGKSCPCANYGRYKNILMRSSWEIAYAKYLDKLGIKWQYEPKRFDLGNTTYTPDFYLSKKKVYVEIKGWLSLKAYIKLKKFIQKFPKKKLIILRKEDLIKEGVLSA